MANSTDTDQLADMDLHCLQRLNISRLSRIRVNWNFYNLYHLKNWAFFSENDYQIICWSVVDRLHKMGRVRQKKKKVSSGKCGQRRPRPACESAKSDHCLHRPLKELFDITEYMDGEQWKALRRLIWVCTVCQYPKCPSPCFTDNPLSTAPWHHSDMNIAAMNKLHYIINGKHVNSYLVEGFENAAKMRVGLNIYLWNPT